VVNTIEVLVQALILPLATVPSTGAVRVTEVLVQLDRLPLVGVPNTGVSQNHCPC
jgi:hypothetical protein